MEGNKDRKHFLSGGSANPRDAKRAKLRSARTIMANNQEPALRDGRLDVPDFLAARKYEIQQMERAMQNSRQAAKQRAFQSLPRVLRRRTASHNVKRIPKRLRKRAEREMADDKTPALAKKNKKLRAYARVKQLALERRLQRAAGNKITKLNPSISLPKNVVVTLDAKDPRFSYPPQPVRKVRSEDELVELITGWPENEQLLVKESALFTPDTLNESYKNQCSQKLVERRKRAAGPGQPVKTSSDDPKIPVILFKNTNNSWTVLLPWGWVLPVWHSLLHLNDVHIGGVEQEHQIAFESGRLYFPDDYPGTPAGVAAEFENSKERKDTWIRKPASKRVSYSRIKIREGKDMKRGEEGSPFKCDWKFLARVVKNAESDAAVEIEEDITAEHILEELKQVNEKETAVKPATHRLKSNKSVYECPVLPSYVRFQNVLAKSGSELETETGVDKLEIIPVRLNFVQRGSPSAPAHIYRLPEGFDIAKHKKHNKITDDKIVCPPTNHLIGFVTTGTYNLMEGNGSAVGSILATSKGQYCLVRNVGSATTRLAKWEKITL
ncbi:hypothetical protein DS838_001026 [Geotrichum bryndzae]|nr:hypothetical protein DV454_002637 [Geotrichum candidum]KAI9214094.1 hypothetical protein DS838_001026 [Geotrichum bryndzae]